MENYNSPNTTNQYSANPLEEMNLLKAEQASADVFSKMGTYSTPSADYDIRKTAKELLGKKINGIFIWMWISLTIYLGPTPLIGLLPEDNMFMLLPFMIIGGIAFFVLLIIYCSLMSTVKKSLRTLVKTNRIYYINEITSGNYNSNGTVYFSSNLMYHRKCHVVLAYDDIMWVYLNYENGRKNTIFNTVDGKSYIFNLDEPTIKELITRKPHILVGYTNENRIIYNDRVKQFKASLKGR